MRYCPSVEQLESRDAPGLLACYLPHVLPVAPVHHARPVHHKPPPPAVPTVIVDNGQPVPTLYPSWFNGVSYAP